MARNLVSTRALLGRRVFGGKDGEHAVGKVRAFVFHPRHKRCIGFTVKRPDVALMFHRKDLFVAYDRFDAVEGGVRVRPGSDMTDDAACRRLGVSWDDCVLWVGLPVICENGTVLGYVGGVTYDAATGAVHEVDVDAGATANALLGTRTIPTELVRGFRVGIGAQLAMTGAEGDEDDDPMVGALLVSDEAVQSESEGGLAEKAGKATAVAKAKARNVAGKAASKAKPAVSDAAAKTGSAIGKGAYAAGKQIGRTKGMFSAFKDEYRKARHGGGR